MAIAVAGSSAMLRWKFIQQTGPRQKDQIARENVVATSIARMRDKLTKKISVDDLMQDIRSLKHVLVAFGLEGDIQNKFFIKKVMTSDLSDTKSLANKLVDPRYRDLSRWFDASQGSEAERSAAEAQLQTQFLERELERRVGETDDDLRLIMSAKREIADIANANTTEKVTWFNILGSRALSKFFSTALGLGNGFGNLDLDKKVDVLRYKLRGDMGTDAPGELLQSKNFDRLAARYFARSDLQLGMANRFAGALQLLR